MIRQPIVTVVGHIDHGKTTLLDSIRKSAVTAGEAGGITQCISCSSIPFPTIKDICGPLLDQLNLTMTVPGLLFIDTPGHAAFTNLRKRGGNLADIAILIIDINEGFKPQSIEALEILKTYKTPFIIAANKIDLIPGWQKKAEWLMANIKGQAPNIQTETDKRLYTLVGTLSEHELQAERFDRIDDFTKQIAIVPISAKTGQGIPELLMVLLGLAQRYLEKTLECDAHAIAKGTVLEVKEAPGLGKTMDVIVYDGELHTNDTLVIGGLDKAIITKVRALFEPPAHMDIREKSSKFEKVNMVCAAAGVKIVAPDIDDVISGMPLRGSSSLNVDQASEDVQKEVEEVLVETDKRGIVIKAESLGSVEALLTMLKQEGFDIKRASVGPINKKDILEAEASLEKDPLDAVIVGFNVRPAPGIQSDRVQIMTGEIIYSLIDGLKKWRDEEKQRQEEKQLDTYHRPCKIELLQGYVFRQSNPAVIGVEVLAGKIKTGMPLMNKDGKKLTTIKSMQLDKESVKEADKGKQLAVAMPDVTVERQIHEGDIMYSAIPEMHFRQLKKYKKYLTKEETEVIREIAAIKRKNNPVWGV